MLFHTFFNFNICILQLYKAIKINVTKSVLKNKRQKKAGINPAFF